MSYFGLFKLLCVSGDAKTVKGEKHGYLTGLTYLAPHKLSGLGNTCPWASPGCACGCLNTAGRGKIPQTQQARIRKTRWFFKDRADYLKQLDIDINMLVSVAQAKKMTPVVRLNATSDLPWEKFGVMDRHPLVQFYDYTKNPHRMQQFLLGGMPKNYHLTFSRSETNEQDCKMFLELGGNVAVVFNGPMPKTWWGFNVAKGDDTDLRFLDGYANVIGLTAKGRAKRDTSGFVVKTT